MKDTRSAFANLLCKTISNTPTILTSRIVGQFACVFMLHRIQCEALPNDGYPQDILRSRLKYLRKHNFNIISAYSLVQLLKSGSPIPPKTVTFTIDDGFRDNVVTAGEIFAEFDVPLTCFVITGFVEGELWPWDDQVSWIIHNSPKINKNGASQDLQKLVHRTRQEIQTRDNSRLYSELEDLYQFYDVQKPSQVPPEYTPASWGELNSFSLKGHDIAPHSRSDRILSRLSDSEAKQEILDSINSLQAHTNMKPIFAYPTGRQSDYSDATVAILEDLPIEAAFDTTPKHCTDANRFDLYRIPRFPLPLSEFDFYQYISFIEKMKNVARGYRRV